MHPFFHRLRTLLVGGVRTAQAPASPEAPREEAPPEPEPRAGETVLTVRSSTIIRMALLVLLVVTGFRLVAELIDVLLLVIAAIVIASALQPFVDRMQRRRWPRALTAAIVFVIVIGLVVLIIVTLVPLLAEQVLDLARNVTAIVQKLFSEGPQTLPFIGSRIARFTGNVDPQVLARSLEQPLQDLGRSLLGKTSDAVGAAGSFAVGLLDSVAVIIISFYMVVRRSNLDGFIRLVTPRPYAEYAVEKQRLAVGRMGAWLRAQFLVMLLVFLLSWIGFSIIGLKYGLFLALLAGICSIVPVVGWIVAGLLAMVLAITQSSWMVVGVLVIILIVHFADSYIFVPLVTEHAVGVSPVAVIIALLVGYKLAGILGVLLAVPVTTALASLFEGPRLPRRNDAPAP